MKKFADIYQSSVLLIGALGLMVICWYQHKDIKALRDENFKVKLESESLQGGDILKSEMYDSISALKDSFYYENFNNVNIVGRYESALQMLKEQNPKAAEEFELILSTKTE